MKDDHNVSTSFWTRLFYASLVVLSVWLILKVTGVIQTPLWLEYGVPIASIIIGAFSFFQELMQNMSKLNVGFAVLSVQVSHIDKDVDGIKNDIRLLKTDVAHLKVDVAHLKVDVAHLKNNVG